MFFRRMIIVCFALSVMLASCSEGQTQMAPTQNNNNKDLTHIRLILGNAPNLRYVPFYVADHHDFYREIGIEIEFDYTFEAGGTTLVASDELQFALASGEQVLLARAGGFPVVSVMSWYRDYPIAVVAKPDQGIQSPRDLAGKRVGIPDLFGAGYVGLRALLNAGNLSESDIILESIGFNQVEALASDQVDAVVVYLNDEPIRLQEQGYNLDIIRVADYVQLVSNVLIANETTISANPDLVQRMVQATLRGIKFSATHPDEAYEISENYVEGLVSVGEVIRAATVERYTTLYQTDPLGYSDPAAWENTQNILLDMGLLTEPIDLSAAFTNDFIE